jgi:hypothetical protein
VSNKKPKSNTPVSQSDDTGVVVGVIGGVLDIEGVTVIDGVLVTDIEGVLVGDKVTHRASSPCIAPDEFTPK